MSSLSLTISSPQPLHQARILPSRSITSQEIRRWSKELYEDNEDLTSMIKTTMKLMNQLNKKGLEFNPKTGRFSPKGEYSGGNVKCYNCGEKGHIASKCSKPKKNQDRAKGNGKATTGKKNLKNHGYAYVG